MVVEFHDIIIFSTSTNKKIKEGKPTGSESKKKKSERKKKIKSGKNKTLKRNTQE